MADPTPRPGARRADRRGRRRGRHRSRRPALPALVLAGVTALVVAIGASGAIQSTLALWNDDATVSTGTVSTGAMDLQLKVGTGETQAVGLGTDFTADTAQRGTIAFTGLAPGETRAFNVAVSNVGNPTFRWSVSVTKGTTWTFTDPAITVQIFAGTAGPADTSYPVTEGCPGGVAQTSAVTVTAPSGSSSPHQLVTNRPLAAGSSDAMCVVIGIAAGAGNENQSKTGLLQFDFVANQVAP